MRGSRTVGAALGILLGAGCGPAPYTLGPEEPAPPNPTPQEPPVYVVVGQAAAPKAAQPAREPEARWIPDGFPRPNPFAERRTWIGSYVCAQGPTNLTLRIVDVHGTKVRAIFDFHHPPTDVAGQFIMAGAFDEQTGRATLTPGAWLLHPDNYMTVAMAGRVSRDGTSFEGRIAGPGCGPFRLRAVE